MFEFLRELLGISVVSHATSPSHPASDGTVSCTVRQGELVPIDEVFHAWTSGELGSMLKALDAKTNPIDRHFLLMGIVGLAYKERSNSEMARLCSEISELHLNEFPNIAAHLKEDMGGVLPRVTTFQQYATLLAERGEFSKAIQVCQLAIGFGLHDGTKSDFRGRIKRIEQLQTKA